MLQVRHTYKNIKKHWAKHNEYYNFNQCYHTMDNSFDTTE